MPVKDKKDYGGSLTRQGHSEERPTATTKLEAKPWPKHESGLKVVVLNPGRMEIVKPEPPPISDL